MGSVRKIFVLCEGASVRLTPSEMETLRSCIRFTTAALQMGDGRNLASHSYIINSLESVLGSDVARRGNLVLDDEQVEAVLDCLYYADQHDDENVRSNEPHAEENTRNIDSITAKLQSAPFPGGGD